jgi:hypothetical protein
MQRINNLMTNPKSKSKAKNIKFVSNNQFDILAETESDESTTPGVVESLNQSIETSTPVVEYQIDLELGQNSSQFASRQQSVNFVEDYSRFDRDGSISNFASNPAFFDSEEDVISFLRGGKSSSEDCEQDGLISNSRGSHIFDCEMPRQTVFPSTDIQSAFAFAFPSSDQQSLHFVDDFDDESTPQSSQYNVDHFDKFEKLQANNPELDIPDLFNLFARSLEDSSSCIDDEVEDSFCATIPPRFKETDNSKTRRAIECLLEVFAKRYAIDSFQTPISFHVEFPDVSKLEGCTGRDDFNINLAFRNPKTIATIHDWIHANYPNTMRDNTILLTVLERHVKFSLRPKPPVVPARDIEGSFVHALVNGDESATVPNPDNANLKTGGGGGGSSKAKASDVKASNAKTSETKAPAKKERITPARHESWPESAKIIELLAAANETEDGKTASITCFIKGNFEDFQTWCYHETGKKSIQIGTGKEDSIRVRIFKGDRKDFTGGGSRKDSKR